MSRFVLLVLGLAAVANAHMQVGSVAVAGAASHRRADLLVAFLRQLAYPYPYNSPLNSNTPEASKDYSMTSPLVNSGIYPCKVCSSVASLVGLVKGVRALTRL